MSEPRMVWSKHAESSRVETWWKIRSEQDKRFLRDVHGDNIQPVLLPVGADASLVSLFRALPSKAKP